MANASAKHSQIVKGLQDIGYMIEKSNFTCEMTGESA